MTKLVRRLNADHDIHFGKGIRDYATGTESTAQRVRTALLLIAGEWFLDTSAGTPWFALDGSEVRPIMGVPADLGYTEAVLKARILGVDGVTVITSFDMTLDHATRHLSGAVVLTDADGATFTVEFQDPGP